jgi:four helix bundle protein
VVDEREWDVSKIERFEELTAWAKARALTHSIYEVSKQGTFGKDFGLSNQIQRAAVSVMSNIAEGLRGEVYRSFASS